MELAKIDEMIFSDDSSLKREAAALLAEIGGDSAFDRLEILLKDHNNGVRDAAQNSIIMLGGRTAIEKMIPLLTNEDPSIRNMAIDILRKIGIDGVDILHGIAKDTNDNIRLFVLDILGSIGNQESMDVLIEGLYDTNPNVRNAAVISLGEIGGPAAFEHLKKLINDEEWIRFSVIESFARIPHDGVVKFLLDEVKRWSNDEITTCAILETLGKIGSRETIQPLMSMLKSSDEYVEVSIAQTLLKIMSPDDISALDPPDRDFLKRILEAHLLDADDDFQRDMLVAMGSIGNCESALRIIELAKKVDPDLNPEKWEDIRSALIALNDIPFMVSLLDADEKTRMLSSQILCEIGGEDEGREISARILTTQGYVKRAMTDALARIGGLSSRDTLRTLIHDQDGHVVTSSLKALGEIGNPEDIDEIMPFLQHPYPDVRNIALEAIALIGTDKAENCFMTFIRNTDPKIRIMALGGLERTRSEKLGEAVAYMLRDQDWEARMSAVKVTKDMMLSIENDLLMALLNDEHDEIRHLAIDIVGQRKLHGLRSFLEDAVTNDEMWTSYHAIEALGQFRDDDAKLRLLSILKSGPDFLRISAVKTLGGWEDESLASELEIYMDDDNLDVARAVAEAMDKLQGVSF